jgi:polysaccharide deacetylase 2 family uncharacterized protein YibQ
MSEAGDGTRSVWRRPVPIAGATLVFVAATALFVQLLRPLVDGGAAMAAAPPSGTASSPAPAPPHPTSLPPTEAPAKASAAFAGPRIAILLTEMGADPSLSRSAVAALPAGIGFAFTPYGDVGELVTAARRDGHEIWLGMPMQPRAYPKVDPGPHTLLVATDTDENLRRLDWALARVAAPAGVTNMMGSAFTENAAALRPVLAAIGARDLAFLDARASARSVAGSTARGLSVPVAVNDRFLDENGSIDTNLAALEALARRRGHAIGYARPLPETVAAIAAWTDTLDEKGIILVSPRSLTK